jgi:hypothetical protein
MDRSALSRSAIATALASQGNRARFMAGIQYLMFADALLFTATDRDEMVRAYDAVVGAIPTPSTPEAKVAEAAPAAPTAAPVAPEVKSATDPFVSVVADMGKNIMAFTKADVTDLIRVWHAASLEQLEQQHRYTMHQWRLGVGVQR